MAVFSLFLAALVWQSGAPLSPDPIADPHARRGGTLRFNGSQPPKSMNAYVDSGQYTSMMFSLMYESLLTTDSSTLEFAPCLACRWAVSSDGRSFSFELDPAAHWSDGEPVTADDVKWTFDAVVSPKSDTGAWKVLLGGFDSPVVESPRRVRFCRTGGSPRDWRDLLNCATFPILPKHAFGGRDFNKLEFPGAPVSGAYSLVRVAEQVESEFAYVPTWWRADRIDCRGTCNFDRILLRYFVDNENAFEAFKKRTLDVYPVYTARIMAEGTRGEDFARNRILKRCVRNHRPIGYQGFAMNMRRKPFDDVRVRRAMAMLIDRETMNRTMMNGAYFLMNSYYTDLYTKDAPCPNVLVRYDPVAAKNLLAEAGYPNGFSFTFLSRSSTEDKFLALFDHALSACGVKMSIVRKDFAGWMRDMDGFNYDMTWAAWGASIFKNPEASWLSTEADRKGSNNITGFKSAAVDALIASEKSMTTMAERTEAYRRIDVLVASEHPYALLWNTDSTRLLYWNKFGMPKTVLSRFSDEESILTYWWYDDDKAGELEESLANGTSLPDVPYEVNFDDAKGQHD